MSRSKEVQRTCICCGYIIPENRNSRFYCCEKCRIKSSSYVHIIMKEIAKRIFDPIFQSKQLGLHSFQHKRVPGNYGKFYRELVLHI